MSTSIESFIRSVFSARPSADIEAGFSSLLRSHNLDSSQLVRIRDEIFAAAKESVIATTSHTTEGFCSILDRVQSLVRAFEKTKLQPQPRFRVALFFPDDPNSFHTLYDFFSRAKTSLDICVFTITDDRVAHVVLDAHHRGVKVRVITDDEKANDVGADSKRMAEAGIPVRIDNSPYHMHHKFCIIGMYLNVEDGAPSNQPKDNAILINGSYNWTRSASNNNNENVIIIDDSVLISYYRREFERLWKKFGPIEEADRPTEHEAAMILQAANRGKRERAHYASAKHHRN